MLKGLMNICKIYTFSKETCVTAHALQASQHLIFLILLYKAFILWEGGDHRYVNFAKVHQINKGKILSPARAS